jgi:hypothetical protein
VPELPTITNPEPVVTPAVAEVTYPEKYIIKLEGLTPTGQSPAQLQDVQALLIGFRPYNKTTQRLYGSSDHDTYHTIPNIWTEAARVPLFAQALGLIVTVAGLLDQERYLVEAIADPETPAENLAAMQASLVEVQTALGIS